MIIAADATRGAGDITAFPQPGSLESLAAGRELDRLAGHAGYSTATQACPSRPLSAGIAAGELPVAPARAAALPRVLPGVARETEIRLARWGADAGVRGAALMAHNEVENGRP
jgi:hypothetical protein